MAPSPMKTFLASALALLGLCGCSRKPAPFRAGTYVQLEISDMDSLDPAWSYDTASTDAILQMYEPLFAYKGSSATELEPLIAERVPSRANGLISKDGRTYRIPIRKGVRFHDGSLLTPEDVRYSILRFMLQDRVGGPSSLLLEPLVGYAGTREKTTLKDSVYEDAAKAVRVEGDSVVLTLPRPFAPLLAVLAMWAPALHREWCAKHGDWDGRGETWKAYNNRPKEASPLFAQANGTGPFELERRDQQGKEIVFKRFDGYWRGPARLAQVIVKGVDEFSTRKLMLQAGDADSIYADRLQQPLLENMPGVQIIDDLPLVEMNPAIFFTVHLDAAGNPNLGSGKLDGAGIPPDFFADPDVRKGFAHAFDYEGYIRDVARGKGTRAAGFIPKGLLGYREGLRRRDFDLARAEKYLRRAFGGRLWETGFRFTLSYNAGNQPREAIASMMKRSIEGLNPRFRVDTRPIQWSTYLDAMSHSKLPIYILGWSADYPDPHNYAFTFMHSQGAMASIQRYSNPEADRLVGAAVRELDPKKRIALYGKLHELFIEEVPSLTVLNSLRYRTQRDWVKGFVNRPIWPDDPYSGPFYALEKVQN